jgi:hypothetical protein
MIVFACMMHWYESAMFAVPTGVIGVWGWWSSRHMSEQADQDAPGSGESFPFSD